MTTQTYIHTPRSLAGGHAAVTGIVGESKPLQLNAPQTAFARNTSDTFQVKAPWLGALTQIRVGHNARGSKPDWMLDWVRIKHPSSGQQWVFFAHRWLHSGNNNELVLKPGKHYTLFCCTAENMC